MSVLTVARGVAGFRGTGCMPSPADSQDRIWEQLAGATRLPETWDDQHLRRFVPTIWDQGGSNSCVAQAIAQAIAVIEAMLGMPYDPLSRRWLYLAARLADRIEGDVGSRIRTALVVLRRQGCMSEDAHPWSTARLDRRPSVDLIIEGHGLSGLSYRWIMGSPDDRLRDVRSAIESGSPVVFAGPVSHDYQRLDRVRGQEPWGLRERTIGHHARVLVQARADGHFVECNSYGRGWANGGLAVIEDSYIAEEAFDLVVINDWRRARAQMESLRA